VTDLATGAVTVLEPPVPHQGARRVWSDSHGGLRITGWNSGDLFRCDSKTGNWAAGVCRAMRRTPTQSMSTRPIRCGSATGVQTRSCALDPRPENSSRLPCPIAPRGCASWRAGCGGVWGAESRADKLLVLKAE